MNKYLKAGLIILIALAVALGLLRRNTHILGNKDTTTGVAADKSLEQYYQQSQQLSQQRTAPQPDAINLLQNSNQQLQITSP